MERESAEFSIASTDWFCVFKLSLRRWCQCVRLRQNVLGNDPAKNDEADGDPHEPAEPRVESRGIRRGVASKMRNQVYCESEDHGADGEKSPAHNDLDQVGLQVDLRTAFHIPPTERRA